MASNQSTNPTSNRTSNRIQGSKRKQLHSVGNNIQPYSVGNNSSDSKVKIRKVQQNSVEEKSNSTGKTIKLKPIASSFITKKRRASHYIDPMDKKPKRILFKGSINSGKYPVLFNYFNKKILINEYICDAPDGIYTWIQSEISDIYATQIESNQEIGTLHMNLIHLIEKRDPSLIVNLSGEFEIKTDAESGNKIISYNFQSGYFVDKILKELRKKYSNETNQQIQERLSTEFFKNLKSKCPECKIIPKLDEDFIENTKFISNEKVIKLYRNLYNNVIQEEENIGNEIERIGNKPGKVIKYNYKVNLTNLRNINGLNMKRPYSRNEYNPLKGEYNPLKGGKYTYKNKRNGNRTYKKYKK